MSTKLLMLTAFFLCIAFGSFAQQFDLPENIQLQQKEDYARYEQDIIKAANWYEATPIGNDADKRKAVGAFIVQWISGSPNVSINMNGNFLMKYSGKNAELMVAFMAGYARYVLQSHDTSQLKGTTAGIQSVITLYKLGGKAKKEKNLPDAIKALDEGKLEEWVTAHMNDVK